MSTESTGSNGSSRPNTPSPLLRTAAVRLVRPVLGRLQARIDDAVDRLRGDLQPQLDELRQHQHAELQRQLDEHWARLDRLESRINELQFGLDFAVDETRRLEPHIAALEERVTTLAELAHDRLAQPADGELAEARSVLAEVRTEHARMRARLTAMAKYEERIGRLEEAADQSS